MKKTSGMFVNYYIDKHGRFAKQISEVKRKLIHNSNYIEEMEFKINKFEKENFTSQLKGIISKQDAERMSEFKFILDEANRHYQHNLSLERDARTANEHELDKLRREIEMRNESKVEKPMQTNLKWVVCFIYFIFINLLQTGDVPVKVSMFWG